MLITASNRIKSKVVNKPIRSIFKPHGDIPAQHSGLTQFNKIFEHLSIYHFTALAGQESPYGTYPFGPNVADFIRVFQSSKFWQIVESVSSKVGSSKTEITRSNPTRDNFILLMQNFRKALMPILPTLPTLSNFGKTRVCDLEVHFKTKPKTTF